MGGHDWFTNFDRDVCEGEHPDVDGVCEEKIEGVVDRCAVCGCTLAGLSLANSPPEDCVRRDHHRVEDAGGAPDEA